MCWIVKEPKRWDFCGMPPCPLCYDWAEPASPREDADIQTAPVVVPGIDKFAFDLTGYTMDFQEPDKHAELERQAELVHERNKARAMEDQFTLDDEEKRMAMWLALKRKEALVKPSLVVRKNRTLDQMDLDKRPAEEPVKQPATIREPETVKQPAINAFVDASAGGTMSFRGASMGWQELVLAKDRTIREMAASAQEQQALQRDQDAFNQAYYERYRDPYRRRFR